MRGVDLIGEDLFFEGEHVASLTERHVSPSQMGRFLDALENSVTEDDQPKDCDCPPRKHELECEHYKAEDGVADEYGDALDDLARAAKEYAKGGLLRMSDLATIIAQLKEE